MLLSDCLLLTTLETNKNHCYSVAFIVGRVITKLENVFHKLNAFRRLQENVKIFNARPKYLYLCSFNK